MPKTQREPEQPVAERRSSRKRAKVDYTEPSDSVGAGSTTESAAVASTCTGSVKQYRDTLIRQKKDLYKDPPALPPQPTILPKRATQMSRHSDGTLRCADFSEFRPNLSPSEVLQRGSFGGTYFRSIESAVTQETYGPEVLDEFPKDWFQGLKQSQLRSKTYHNEVNRWGVKCGGSLGMWESSGWIAAIDPYGWFQWYCRFYMGRRSTDDERQVNRWKSGHGPKGRFRSQLLTKIIVAGGDIDNAKVSPVVRQTCQHWGYCPCLEDLEAHRKRKGL